MPATTPSPSRRTILRGLAATGLATLLPPSRARAQPAPVLTKPIPSTNEPLPVVGLGSWVTFNVGDGEEARAACAEVMRNFFAAGGRLIDSSPMYGSSQAVIGWGLDKLGRPPSLFAADKVWTSSSGPDQIEQSRRLWGVTRFDLLQVHNLLSWQQHLPTLFAMKAEPAPAKAGGRLRYVGITTSEGRRHEEIEQVMRTHPIDFVQVTYNVVDREVEDRILPLAQDRGIAVIINRPFQRGALIRRLAGRHLPAWAAEIGCTGWPQFLLKFIVSHPAVTCAIPATSSVAHVRENMGAAAGPLPDEKDRRRMAAYVEQL
jgi:diketogulonate reductase-like aldo/keto reductase